MPTDDTAGGDPAPSASAEPVRPESEQPKPASPFDTVANVPLGDPEWAIKSGTERDWPKDAGPESGGS